jgi:hypothetical protein
MTFVKHLLATALIAGLAVSSASAAVFPLKSDDLNLNHRYKTGNHSTGAQQGHGKDIIGLRHKGNNQWSDIIADNADWTDNTKHIIYGRKVYAMVSGTVVNCWRNAPENSKSGTKDQDVLDFYIGVAGNHVLIKTDDGTYAEHAHMIPGTIAESICPNNKVKFDNPSSSTQPAEGNVVNGAKITKGQYLGLAGNSGNSTQPHVHVHMIKDGLALPMPIEHGQTTPFTNGVTSPNGPWTLTNGNALPTGNILVWAPRSKGNWTVNNITSAAFQGWFNHLSDSGNMPENIPCTNGGAIYNTTWVPSQGAWYARAGMSAAELSTQNTTLTNQGFYLYKWWYCDSIRSAIWRK